MHAWIPIAAVILVAAITPGPNNVLLLRLAASRGAVAALPAVGGVVAGGLVLLAIAWLGLTGFLTEVPRLRDVIVFGGSAYLIAAGIALIRHRKHAQESAATHAPDGLLGLLLFQFVNPKSWTLVLTLAAAARADSSSAAPMLFALFGGISAVCALIWVGGGHALARVLSNPTRRARFDASMGALLVLSALALPFQS
jgi:threonine/homoserine/homoserine lactone efflux protein